MISHRTRILLLAVSFVSTLTTQARAEGPADQKNPFADNAEAIAFGKSIFEATCTGYCHTTVNANRVGRCPNLFDCEWKRGGADGQIYTSINNGVPNTEMVGFKGRLPDEMIWKITAYLRSASLCKEGQPATPAH